MTKKKNIDVREAAKAAGVYLWEIAAAIGVSEPTLIKRMRMEIPAKDKVRLFEAIKQISIEKEVQSNE